MTPFLSTAKSDDRRVVDHLAQPRLGVAQRLRGAARVGHVDHEAEHSRPRTVRACISVRNQRSPPSAETRRCSSARSLPSQATPRKSAEEPLAVVGVQALDEELRVAGAASAAEAEARERAAGGEGDAQRLGVGGEDDGVEAAEQLDRGRRAHRRADAAASRGQ